MKVGVIGAGGVSRFHLAGYAAAGAQVVAIADAHAETLERVQAQWRVPRGYADFHALCADPEIEAVSVCLPNALHHPATIAAARAGKHVLCEKPVSMSLSEAHDMIRACREAGVVLQVGHHLRSNPAAEKARQLIESGELGRVTFVRLRQAHDWGGQEPRASFRTLASAGGGTLLDNGSHMMDLARYFGGPVREVFARMATLGYDVEVEDTSVVTLEFASGALGSVENAWTATGWEEAFWVYGTRGALEYTNRLGRPTMRHVFRSSPGTDWNEQDVATYQFAGLEPHSRNVLEFLEAVRGERRVICSGEDGLEAVRLILASYRSARERRPVEVSEVT
ncbi:Gfo/Idh/MocA family protein [Deinococcus pimensis]|uniref:Gfo/Idh/MocA family protein n=1 Tax=Deinococcus pimensis TaxID=309888 RepID=UPI0004806981|nr:Gfo/Idh/MocA family oxidoreductase [Deinococcus pimensis]